ncbi:hypothetical protein RJ640_023494 [Escallonia rubra]|uniref:BAG domain-containing protein n=1 Tax=Escallonia rubra TaxID=112253 RepID=A0AA88S4Z2_9ASTE|nr:hypothetical protein RJ640_023494 [Escallonia rubra]
MAMNSGRKPRFSTTTTTYQNDHPVPQAETITVHLPITTDSSSTAAAVKIQSTYRSHRVRTLIKKISSVNLQATHFERLIQRQETVDAVRTDARERIRMNEALMGMLLSLDSVPGVDPTVRELRRRVSRRIVGLQEILDAVSGARVEGWDGFLRDWDDAVAGIEEEVCRERGDGGELERFCAEHLGFRCLQRFLRDQ